MFEIRQFNSDDYQEEELDLCFKLTSKSFGATDDNLDEHIVIEKKCFKNSELPTQHFYIYDTVKNKFISSAGVLIRPGNNNEINLIVKMVCTDSEYRRCGLIQNLMNYMIQLYECDVNECGLIKLSENFQVDTKNIEMGKKFIDKQLVNFKPYWTLYSAVGEFYSRFGFESYKTMNFLKIGLNDLINEKVEEFNLNENEEFLTLDNLNYYLTDDQFLPKDYNKVRCSSFKYPTTSRFVEQFNGIHKVLPNFGIVIKTQNDKNEEKITILCVTHFFNPKLIFIDRFFTNIDKDDKELNCHFDRCYEYLLYFVNKNNINKETMIFIAEGDIINENKDAVLEQFISKNKKWESDKSNKLFNPMIREWKQETKQSSWDYNGLWCFT